MRPSHLRFGLTVLFVALVFLGRSFELSPTSAVQAAPLAELVLYDDAFQNGYSASSWSSPQPDPSYTANVFEGSFALRKNLFISGGIGEFMAIHSAAGLNTADYTHIEFYATSISAEGAKVRVRFASEPWKGSPEEVPIDIPFGLWTRYEIPFSDFGPTVLDKQYKGVAFSGGGPGAASNDTDNDVVFDNIKLVKLPDTSPPLLFSAQAVGSTLVRATFSEKIDPFNAASTLNYVVSSSMDPGFLAGQIPSGAELLPNQREVELTLASSLTDGNTYDLKVSNISDLAGNTILPDSQATFVFDDIRVNLSVDAGVQVYPFNPMMRGSQLPCWMHEQVNKPGPNDAANLWEVAAAINPSIIRYCGGLWANNIGWDRQGQAPNNGNWQYTDPVTGVTHPFVYTHSYKPVWIDDLASFLSKINAEAMIQANLCDDNAAMWADMVNYANVENNYNFKYWELSNELELSHGDGTRQKCFGSSDKTIAAQEYAKRFVKYVQAMKAVDPTIKVMGPVPANYYSASTWFTPLIAEMKAAGLELDVLSWHWYQLFNWDTDPASKTYDFGSVEALLNYNTALTDLNLYNKGEVIDDPTHWLYRSRRVYAEFTPQDARSSYALADFPNVELAITEHNTNGAAFDHPTNGNHIGALWMADVLPRAAYAGQDINIWYELYDGDFNKYGLIYPDNDVAPTKMFVRPTYYTMLMYSQWFGDTLVESSTSDSLQNVVVWASTDSSAPDTLKLMLINLNSSSATVNVGIAGFTPQSGQYYEMTSTDPESLDPALTWDSGETTINGHTVDTTAGAVQASIDAIAPGSVTGIIGTTVTHVLPAYSVTAMVLSGSGGLPGADTTPPVLSNLSPTGVLAAGTTQATLALSTDENATCRFGTAPGVDYASLPNTFSSAGGTAHSAAVSGLQDGRSYVYYVRCQDSSGNANGADAAISFSVDSASTTLNPHEWPAKVDLAVGESYVYTLRDDSQRTLKLVSYNIVVPKRKIEATVQVSGNGRTQTHTLEVALAGVPVSINGLRVYAYTWKEANSVGFENVWPSGAFPLTPGKDVGFGVSDARYTMYPDMGQYTYPATIAFHEGVDLLTFSEEMGDGKAHSGYDFGIQNTAPLVAMFDGWAWRKQWSADQGGIWLTKTNSEFGAPEAWIWTHVKDGAMLVPHGTFVTKGTLLGYAWDGGNRPYHYHMGSKGSLDFGSWLFAAEIWNYEHQDDFPAPRYWLALGSFPGGMTDSYIYSDESGDIPETILPRKGDLVNGETWKFGDNFVNSVVRMEEVLSELPFSGNDTNFETNSVGYAGIYIYSSEDHTNDNQVWLKWGSSYGAKVWLNGKSVVDRPTNPRYGTYDVVSQSPIVIDESAVPLPLKKGWNTFIAKTNHGSRSSTAWLFSPKIGDVNGNRIPGLRFSARDIDLQVTSVGPNSIGVAWSRPDFQGTHVETYKLDVSLDAGFNSLVKADLDMGEVTSYSITGLSGGLEYFIRVKPYNYSEMGGSVYWQHSDVVSAKTTGSENVPFSRTPPGGLSPQDVPLFVTLGSDDNWKTEGVDWFVNGLYAGRANPPGTGNPATYDGTPARGSFYIMGELEDRGSQLEAALSNAYLQGHEIGNHAYYGDDGGLGSQAAWRDSITRTNTFLTRPVGGDGTIVKGPGGDDRIATGVGVPRSEIYGFRAPLDAYDQHLFPILQETGFTYHSSTAQGHTSQSVDGSTDLWWPGTLDNGIPYAGNQSGVSDTGPSPGLWELPQNFMWLPPGLGSGTILYCDKNWFWAFRDELGYDAQSRAAAITAVLKHNLDLRLQGNRSPFHLCLHSQEWGLASWEQTPEQIAKMAFKQAILTDFLTYALSKPEVRVVRQIDVINWMRNPVPLAGASDTTPPSTPAGLTATPVSESKIDLAWTAASDPESGITGYDVYRDGAKVGTATGTAFSDTGLAQGTSYSYDVSATNGAGLEGPRSNPVAVSTLSTSNNPPITPRWAFEPWVWEDNKNTQNSTENLVDGYLSRNIPVGAVIVDSPWATAYNSFDWDTGRYPQPQQMIDGFHAKGVRVLMWITGFENRGSPDYDFVKAQGYAVDGGRDFDWWKGTGVHLDFTNPQATAWWHTKMDKLLDMGIDGWKVDGSPGPLGAPINTSIGSISRQEFESYYYGDFFDYTLSQNPEGVALARAFTKGKIHAPINKLSIGWPGDDPGTWSGLNRQLGSIYDSADAGYGAFGPEIGGFSCCTQPGKNLLIRWAQLGAMAPLMENGGANGGESAHLPWFHDQQTADIYRYFATLHTELVPYLFSYGVEAHLRGISIIRNPDKPNKQHQLGEEIFVSVLGSDTTLKTVVFPSGGDWIDFWDHSRVYPGGTTTAYDVPLNRYPIFIKAGAIIPLRVESGLTGFGDTTSAGKETILIFPEGQSSFTYHKPTGDGTAYSDVVISVDEAVGTVTISGATTDDYRLKVKWPVAPASVAGVDTWQYDPATGFITADKMGGSFQVVIAAVVDLTPPSAPSALSAAAISPSRIDLSWTAASDPESGILSYNVYRKEGVNWVKVGTATGTSFSDTSLAEDTSYTYRVSAVNGVGLEGLQSGPVTAVTPADTSPPGILSASSVTETGLSVIFDEPVDQASATDIANYSIDNGISVLSASLGADLRTVTLNTSPHSEGTTYTLTVNNVLDRARSPNVIAPNTQVTYSFAGNLVISGLSVASGKAYEVMDSGLSTGALVYTDRDDRGYAFTTIPAALAGSTYIKTANDDKSGTEENFLLFSVNRGATVYIAYDRRAISLPDWLSGWTDTNETVGTTDVSLQFYKLYSREFAAGPVTLGGNLAVGASGAGSNYSVIVVPGGTGNPVVYPTLAGMSSPVRDNDGDGRAEDVNGNGRSDFADVVGFFVHLNSPAVQDNPTLFNYDSSGQVDMADVVELFDMLIPGT